MMVRRSRKWRGSNLSLAAMPPLYCNSRLREKEITGNLTNRIPGLGRQGKRQKAKGKKKGKGLKVQEFLLLTFYLLRAAVPHWIFAEVSKWGTAAPAVLRLLLAISYFPLNIALRESKTYLFD